MSYYWDVEIRISAGFPTESALPRRANNSCNDGSIGMVIRIKKADTNWHHQGH